MPLLPWTCLACFIQFGILATNNGFYVWFPTILNSLAGHVGNETRICDVLVSKPSNANVTTVIIILQITSVVPKRRIEFTSLEDSDIEGNILFYKECKATGTTQRPKGYDGARSDREDDEEPKKSRNVQKRPPYGVVYRPLSTPPSRRVMKLTCKMCVTVCCGDDCKCTEQQMQQTSGLQMGHGQSKCKTCVTMCCGDNCECKEQLMPPSSTTHHELNQTTEAKQKINKVFTLPDLDYESFTKKNVRDLIKEICFKQDYDVLGVQSINSEGTIKSVTLDATLGTHEAKLTLYFNVIDTGFEFLNKCSVFVNKSKNLNNELRGNSDRRSLNARNFIKNVITHDGDINTILKDLVRVTLQKVEIMKKMDARRNNALVKDSVSGF